MNEGEIDVSAAVTPSATPADQDGQDFYADIPEPQEESIEPQEESAEIQEERSEATESKKSAQSRIKELAAERRAEKERADSLAKQIEELTSVGRMPQYDFGAIQPQSESGEITAEELEQRVLAKATAISQLQLQQQYHAQRIQQEANEAMSAYPELNPDMGDSYDPDLSEAVTEAALAYVRANPTASLKGYINKMMKPYKRSVAKEVGDLANTVTQQVAEKALRPTSTPKGEKRIEDMSEKELEERLGIVY